MGSFTTPLEIQLALGLALLMGLAIGWVARGWGERYERRREDREIEKAGVWRCEDRGYYLSLVKEGGGVREPGCRTESLSTRADARRDSVDSGIPNRFDYVVYPNFASVLKAECQITNGCLLGTLLWSTH